MITAVNRTTFGNVSSREVVPQAASTARKVLERPPVSFFSETKH
jgi:hypothetical protein